MPENALSKPRHAACQVVKQSKLLVMMQDLNRSSTFYIMRPWQPCAGRSSVGREAIVVILAVAKKCCSSRENTGLMVQCDKRCKQKHTHTHRTLLHYDSLTNCTFFTCPPNKNPTYRPWNHMKPFCCNTGFDDDQDGEWWPPPLTEQDVAIRHRAKRLLQANCWAIWGRLCDTW